MMPAIYGNSYQIVQGQGYVAIRYEMIHETRVIPLDGHAARRRRASSSTWATRAATGKATRSSSKRRTSRSAAPTATPTPATLKLIERFTRIAPDKVDVGGHGRRSADLDAAVDVLRMPLT